jgi:hypothetical protein
MSWHRDSYRHSLAARGIKRYSFNPALIAALPLIQQEQMRFRQREGYKYAKDLENTRHQHEMEESGYETPVQRVLNYFSPSTDINILGNLDREELDRQNNNYGDRYSLAAKDDSYRYIGNKNQSAKDFVHDNINGHHDDDRLGHFWSATKHTLFRPADDLDSDWVSFNNAAGRKVVPSGDLIQRGEERGAALLGRVITLANVEPMIDHDQGRSFRDSMIDLEFGRRLD